LTVATFVVDGERVLLLFHAKLRMWLPPGGHVEPNELPDDAAVREVLEETGVACELIGERAPQIGRPVQLVRPEGVQLEPIAPGHEHVDLVYFAVPRDGSATICDSPECEKAGWYQLAELATMGVNDEIAAWCERAVETVRRRLANSLDAIRTHS
jgi:ADP-ribose pyrophosphatase YjhB (NUDIX family)